MSRRSGFADAMLLALPFYAVVAASGCTASALRQHVSAARVLTIAHASIASTVEAVVDAQAAECEQRPEAERASCAAALADVAQPTATAVDALGAGVVGYREAAIAAAEIDSGEAALPALGRMLAGLLESALPSILAALERWGVDVPPEVATYAAAAAAILRAVAGGAL